ncbi:MAG: ECF-type sigma factor [Planctomycetota bacterium]
MVDPLPGADSSRDITRLLHAARAGDAAAEANLVGSVYAELRSLASTCLRGGDADRTTGPTALVHEAWMRLGLRDAQFDDRRHFFGAAARAMRQALVDAHRARTAQKRSHRREGDAELEAIAATCALSAVDLVALDEALSELEAFDARMAQIVQLRYFAGMSVEETAEILAISERTVKREWSVARAWLFGHLGDRRQT